MDSELEDQIIELLRDRLEIKISCGDEVGGGYSVTKTYYVTVELIVKDSLGSPRTISEDRFEISVPQPD